MGKDVFSRLVEVLQVLNKVLGIVSAILRDFDGGGRGETCASTLTLVGPWTVMKIFPRTKAPWKTRRSSKMQDYARIDASPALIIVPFGVTYEKIGTIQRRLAWPLHKDDTLSRSGRPTGLNIYAHHY